jgi:xylulose-5-phosphate/fructose-6-phosphate phosphoketolase
LDGAFGALFGADTPVIFAYHGYPWLIHRLTYRRAGHEHWHVRGYKEEGTTTTPFDMVVLNELDRYHLALDVIARLPRPEPGTDEARRWLLGKLAAHRSYIRRHGDDVPEIKDWAWGAAVERRDTGAVGARR